MTQPEGLKQNVLDDLLTYCAKTEFTETASTKTIFDPYVDSTTLVGSIKTEQEMLKEEFLSLKKELLLLHTFKNEPVFKEGYHNFWVVEDSRWVTIKRATNEKVLDTNAKIQAMVLKLTENNVPVTNSNLRAVGFGSRIILKWHAFEKNPTSPNKKEAKEPPNVEE